MEDTGEQARPGASRQLVTVRIPAGWTLAGLIAGLLAGLLIARTDAAKPVLAFVGPLGGHPVEAVTAGVKVLDAAGGASDARPPKQAVQFRPVQLD